jgi:hypothetical protein
MREVDSYKFIASLKNGDIGLICAKNFFAVLQNLYRKRFKEGDAQASHGFFMKQTPSISEANGIVIKEATVNKNVGDTTKCWIFRYTKLTQEQVKGMNLYVAGAEETAGHYSVGGIMQFAKSFFTGKRNEPDESGVFCTEYTSRIVRAAGLDYISDLPTWQIDPSYQLNWFLNEGPKFGWILAAHYDGQKFFIAE